MEAHLSPFMYHAALHVYGMRVLHAVEVDDCWMRKVQWHDCDNGIGGGCAFARRLSDGAGMDSIRSAIKTIPGS